MKNLLKLSALAAVLVAPATFASAAQITLGSFCSSCSALGGDQNSGLFLGGFIPEAPTVTAGTYTEGFVPTMAQINAATASGASFNVLPNGVWSMPVSGSSWVSSSANGGPSLSGVPNTTINPPQGFYIYNTTFTATAAVYSGTLNLYADDTAAVFLNGVPLTPYGALGNDLTCSQNVPTCVAPLDTINFSQLLLAGTNTLTIVDEQAGNFAATGLDPSGVDFNATLNTVPEPSTLLMLGTGLIGSAGALFRRKRS